MASPSTSYVIALSFERCDHLREGKRTIVSVSGKCTLKDLFEKHHSTGNHEEYIIKTFTSLGVAGEFEVGNCSLTIDELRSNFSEIKYLRFCCSKYDAMCTDDDSVGKRNTRRDAFEVLMAGGRARSFVPKKTSRLVLHN